MNSFSVVLWRTCKVYYGRSEWRRILHVSFFFRRRGSSCEILLRCDFDNPQPCWYLLLVRYFFRWDFDNPQPCYNLHHIGLAQFFWSEKGSISLSLLHLVWCAQLLLALTHLVVEDALGDECAAHPGKSHPAMLHLCRTAKTQNILVFSILMWHNINIFSDPNTLRNPNVWLKPNSLCKYSTDSVKPLNF